VSVTDFLPDQYVTRGVLCDSTNLHFMYANTHVGKIYAWNNR